jgi:plasmid stability protein
MGAMLIRNIDDALKDRLRRRAAAHGRSMEAEARAILRAGLAEQAVPPTNLGEAIHRRFAALGGVDLELPPREPARDPPDFSE